MNRKTTNHPQSCEEESEDNKNAESELAHNASNRDKLAPQKVPYSDSSSAIDCKMLAVSASSTACSFITFRP